MELLRGRTRLAILWIIKVCHNILFFILSLLESGAIEDLMSGKYIGTEVTEGLKIYAGVTIFIPWIMAWAWMTLRVSIIRWPNTILGVIGVIVFLIGMIVNFNKYSSAIIINYIMGVIIFLLIVWYGWRLPKDET